MTEPIEAIDVTDEVELPNEEHPPIPDRFVAMFLFAGSNGLSWGTTVERPTARSCFISARQQAYLPESIRVYRLGGEPKKVSIDWEQVIGKVNPNHGLSDQPTQLWFAQMREAVESQLKGGE